MHNNTKNILSFFFFLFVYIYNGDVFRIVGTMGRICMHIRQSFVDSIQNEISKNTVQAFLDFRGFDFRDVPFNAVYNSILFSLPFSTFK